MSVHAYHTWARLTGVPLPQPGLLEASVDFTMELQWVGRKGCLPVVGQPHTRSEIKQGSEEQTLWDLKIGPCMEKHLMGAGRLLLVLGDTRAVFQSGNLRQRGKRSFCYTWERKHLFELLAGRACSPVPLSLCWKWLLSPLRANNLISWTS